jgi:hypothetical protein
MAHGAKSPSGNAPLAAAPLELVLELALGLSGTGEFGVAFGAALAAGFGAGAGEGAAVGLDALSGVATALAFDSGAAVSFARSAGASAKARASAAIMYGPRLRILANLTKLIAASSFVPRSKCRSFPRAACALTSPPSVKINTVRGGIFLGQHPIQATASSEQCNTPTKRNVGL